MKMFKIPKWESTSNSEEIFHKEFKEKKIKVGRIEKKAKFKKNGIPSKQVKNVLGKQISQIIDKNPIRKSAKLKENINDSPIQPTKHKKTKIKRSLVNTQNQHDKPKKSSRLLNKSALKNNVTGRPNKSYDRYNAVKDTETIKHQSSDSPKKKLNLNERSKSNHNVTNNQRIKKKLTVNNESDSIQYATKSRKKQLTHQTMFFRKSKRPDNIKEKTNVSKISPSLQTPQIYKENWKKLCKLPLRDRMMEKLKAARFRYLNEQMYTTTGKEAKQYFDCDNDSYKAYHEGYRLQVSRWPVNPIDILIKKIKKLSRDLIVADFGCGEAKLAKSVPQKVHSFDLVAINDRVTACDMAHVPLGNSSVDIVVFCLSLMGTNLKEYLMEAKRVLKNNGSLMIAEVESRFEDIDKFINNLRSYGFINVSKDFSHNLFCFLTFVLKPTKSTLSLPNISLKPCLYKKR